MPEIRQREIAAARAEGGAGTPAAADFDTAPGALGGDGLCAWLEEHLAVERVSPAAFPPHFMDGLRANAAAALTNERLHLDEAALDFALYRVVGAQGGCTPLETQDDESPYVAIERRTAFAQTNVAQLLARLVVARGVSGQDTASQGAAFLEYECALRRLEGRAPGA